MFRVGDIVEREVLEGHKQYAVVSVNPNGTHISFVGDDYRYLASYYKLIKPVWKVGDRARVVQFPGKSGAVGHEFTVYEISENDLLDVNNFKIYRWPSENCERVALAPEPVKTQASLKIGPASEEPITLKSIVAREMEIPTYLYDVLEVKPMAKGGTVVMDDAWSVHVDRYPDKLELRNIDGPILTPERLRKLAKLCTDLADLMG